MKEKISLRGRLLWPLGIGFLWLLFLLVLAVWSARSERSHVATMAEREAKAFFQQVVITRAWNAAHGGVYVVSTPQNQPNPYLKEKGRTVETVQGVTLTKINPAYMTRQISTIARSDHDVNFHITSLDPIRPGNKADEWEAEALKEFDRGAKEKFDLVATRYGQFFRYMAPLMAEKRCMRCHAEYGHSDKTILGGISVTFAAEPLIHTRKSSVAQTHLAFTLIFLVGFVGICGSTYLIQKKREEAERANRTKSVFLANMSHDMRTPLNGIMGMTELMQKKGLAHTQNRYAEMVRHAAWTLLEIITDITDFSRLESGRLELSEKVFDVRGMLEEALSVFRFESENKGVALSIEVSPDVPRVLKGDAFRLKQVVTNLVGNAIKFTQDGHVYVRMSLGEPPTGKAAAGLCNPVRVRVEVEDTGMGIPEEEQAEIFESFRQVDESYAKKHEGSGLGLAICKQLVAMMGGTISVDSVLGKGSIFAFDALLCTPGSGEAEEDVLETSAEAPDTPRRRILVAEDNPLNQTFARTILEEAGHEVTLAENGIEALRLLSESEYDMVFMDVQMPEMDGLEATRRVREGQAGTHSQTIPIVAATAFAVPGDRDKCMEAGMNGYVVKPLESRDLLQAVASFTGQAEDMETVDMAPAPQKNDIVIDVELALERLGGRRELFDKLVATFLDDSPRKLAALSEAVTSGNTEEVLRLSHGLKNSAGMVQAPEMAAVALELEMAVREERLTEIPELTDSLMAASDATMLALRKLVEA
ncbi:response regulator [Pseudodesulfovibrio sp. zrk46]|uniref:response regulator n=1 Tax=Pseudodesulfovibrio sp. zrk46 TaxID=2725288 RepID=UPI0014493A97|nr:response regulator [Pseudodesulfovibrio sp. zrk46]QJB55446.1 DUF3365 domain-containing protein [Pseudodesulfovibrio sp. zrk46]